MRMESVPVGGSIDRRRPARGPGYGARNAAGEVARLSSIALKARCLESAGMQDARCSDMIKDLRDRAILSAG